MAKQTKKSWIVSKDRTFLICPYCRNKIFHREDEIKIIDSMFFAIKYCEWCGKKLWHGDEK
jgi:uncharacterized protein with PIN domain